MSARELRMESDASPVVEAGGAGVRRKQRWSDLSPRARTAVVLGAIAELIITTIALRDLARRPSREVRGWKPMWVLLFFVQPFGPLLYFARGRRRTSA